MAKKSVKMKAKIKGDSCNVKAMLMHPMETGQRKDPNSGEVIPAKYIQEVTFTHNEKVVLSGKWGPAVSQNPYVSFSFKGAKSGDTLNVHWKDNTGAEDKGKAKIK